ncbi:MAG: hypothetical protein CVU44_16515 [Chloroflexi bacterium HGW-Chloroflexi-6]|nr:MAG: hypothetical protein CVU44_16515 [Chloroflexi bacterium HGW-Chloroflexi-6]
MNKIPAIAISLLFLFLFGCQSASTVETSEAAPVNEEVALLPTPTPRATQPAPTDHCLECHTDQEKLTSLAKPEVKAEGESKGVG